jgi:hypothetical protein
VSDCDWPPGTLAYGTFVAERAQGVRRSSGHKRRLGMLGSTRLPAERDVRCQSRERHSKGCRRPATDTYSHTPHAAHRALLVSLDGGVLVRDLESLQADNKDECPGQFGSRVQPSMLNGQRALAFICSVVRRPAGGVCSGNRRFPSPGSPAGLARTDLPGGRRSSRLPM